MGVVWGYYTSGVITYLVVFCSMLVGVVSSGWFPLLVFSFDCFLLVFFLLLLLLQKVYKRRFYYYNL